MEATYLVLLSTFFLFAIHLFLKSRREARSGKLPPGPFKLPIIGSMYCLLGSLPHRRLAELADKYGPLMHLQLGEVPTVVVSSPEAAKEVFQTHDLAFCGRPKLAGVDIFTYGGKNLGFAPYGSYWRLLRKVFVVELLTSRRVQSFQSIREEETWNLVRSIAKAAPSRLINLSEEFMSLANSVVARAAFGKRCKEQRKLLRLFREALELAGAFNPVDFFPSSILARVLMGKWESRVTRCHEELDTILGDVLDEHRTRRRMNSSVTGGDDNVRNDDHEDLLDVLLNIQEDGQLDSPLTDENIKAIILDAFVAGTDTSATTMEWAMSEMAKNPNIMKKAQEEVRTIFKGKSTIIESDIQELKYLKMVIKETLRVHPPTPLLVPRECIETCHVLGYKVEKKTRVFINAWAMGRDSRYWDEPEIFKPERFSSDIIDFVGSDFAFVPFGGGRRICPGLSFGLASIELPLAKLIYHFDWILPQGVLPNELNMDEILGLTCFRRQSLQLIALPFTPVLDS